MPSVQRSSKWFIRVTAPWEHIQSKIADIRGQIDYQGLMIGYHHGDKKGAPHAHLCLSLKVELQKQSVDVRYKKLFDVKGAQYSSKPWDGDVKAMSYLYHDANGRVDNFMGLDEKEIEGLRSLNIEIQKVVKTNKERASNRVVDYILKMVEDEKATYEEWPRERIGKEILLAVAHGQFYDPGDFQLEKYINEIELKICLSDRKALDWAIQSRLSRLPSFRR